MNPAGTPSPLPLAATALDAQSPQALKRLRSAALFTTVSGAAYSVLFLISYWLMLDVPGPSSSSDELIAYYESTDGQIVNLIALYLLPFAGIAFLWFIVSVRMWISVRAVRPINELFSNIQFASGLIFLALLFSSAAAMSIGTVAINSEGVETTGFIAREFPLYGGSLFFVFATRMGAMFVFTTTKVCTNSGIIPRWFTFLGFGVGIVMLLTSSFNRWMIVVFPIWVLALCVLTQLHVRGIIMERRETLDAGEPGAMQDKSPA